MENALGDDLPIGIYRSNDKIKNLKIRVRLRKVANACFSEKDALALGDSNELEMVNLMKTSAISTERTFEWQQKIDKYCENSDATSKETSSSKKHPLTINIFSYVNSEILSPEWKNKTTCTFPPSKESFLEERLRNNKPKAKLHFHENDTWQKPMFSTVKNIVKERYNTTGNALPVGESMIIKAALFFEDSSTNEESELCYLHIDDYGTLTVVPDFSNKKSYSFVNSRSETFEYEIENVSNVQKSSAIKREQQLMKKIALHKKKLKEEAMGIHFEKVSSESVTITLNCEIATAFNFEAPDIFVHYLVQAPDGWNIESNTEGVTETCRSKTKEDVQVAYYGYPFSFDVTINTKEYKEDSVKVILDVTSMDTWGNFRNEGYGFADIQLRPGNSIHEVNTWKIEPATLKQKLHHYFIGGMPHLEDISYVIKPKDMKIKQLSKYGVRTLSSGTVIFKTAVIQQN